MPTSRIAQVPMIVADVARLLADLTIYGLSLLPAAFLFRLLWRTGSGLEILAFPAAYCGLVAGFWITIIFMPPDFFAQDHARNIQVDRTDGSALDHRGLFDAFDPAKLSSTLYNDFAPMRYLFYRLWVRRLIGRFSSARMQALRTPGNRSGEECHDRRLHADHRTFGGRRQVDFRAYQDTRQRHYWGQSNDTARAEIVQGAIVGAMALVTKGTRIPAGEILGRVPARKIGSVDVSVQHGSRGDTETH